MKDYSVYSRSDNGEKLVELLVRAPDWTESAGYAEVTHSNPRSKKADLVVDVVGSITNSPSGCSSALGHSEEALSIASSGGGFGGGGATGCFDAMGDLLSALDFF